MEKYFMLNRSPYHDINAIRVHSEYRKNKGGYTVEAEMVMRKKWHDWKIILPRVLPAQRRRHSAHDPRRTEKRKA